MTVEVIVAHRSRWDLLERLLDSLAQQTTAPQVCVVDNGSTDRTLHELERRPSVRVVALGRNLGFARAVNAGVRSSSAEHVLMLNNDMEAEPEYVGAMLAALRSHPRAAVGGLQLRPDGRIDSLGIALDQSLCAYDVAHGLAPGEVHRDDRLRAIGPSGGSAGFRRELFLDVGGYDEGFFAYLEDADLALRLRARGAGYVLAGDARVWHHHSATLGAGSRAKNRLMGRSRGHLLAKYRAHLGLQARVRGAVLDAVVYAGQAVVDRNIGSVEGRIAGARARARPSAGPPPAGISELPIHGALALRLRRR